MSLSCDICCEPYRDSPACRVPRCLPRCGHDLCTGCITLLCSRGSPRCPHCRCPFFLHEENEAKNNSTCECCCSHDGFPNKPWLSWPILRCALQLPGRLDFSRSTATTIRAIRQAPTEALVDELARRRDLASTQDYRICLRRRPSESVLLFVEGFLNIFVLCCQFIVAVFTWLLSSIKALRSEQRIQLGVIIITSLPLLLGSALVFQYPTVVHRFRA